MERGNFRSKNTDSYREEVWVIRTTRYLKEFIEQFWSKKIKNFKLDN